MLLSSTVQCLTPYSSMDWHRTSTAHGPKHPCSRPFPMRRQRAGDVFLWLEAVLWIRSGHTRAPMEAGPVNVFAAATELFVQNRLSLRDSGNEPDTQHMPGDINLVETKLPTSGPEPLHQQLPAVFRRLTVFAGQADKRRLTAAHFKHGASGIAVVVALVSALTTFFYGSPKQAYKRLRMKVRREIPWSWSRYLQSLPVLVETDFPDFPKQWPKHRGKRLVMLVKDVSPKLAAFLHLGTEEKLHGIAIKARVVRPDRTAEDILNEINAHLNMVPYSNFMLPVLGAYRGQSGKNVYLIVPRLRGSVRLILEKEADTVNVQPALAEMAYSVKVLHDAGFLHRDIKLLNFFVRFDGHVVLADFEGLFDKSMWVDSTRDLVVYSDGYLAPEIRQDKDWIRYTEKSDVYALGVCFRAFLTTVAHIPGRAHLQRLVDKMTAKAASERHNMEQVLSSPFFEGINFNEIEWLNQGVPFPGGDEPYEDTRRFV